MKNRHFKIPDSFILPDKDVREKLNKSLHKVFLVPKKICLCVLSILIFCVLLRFIADKRWV